MQKRGYKMVVLSISASFSILILFSRCSSRIGAELAGLPLQRLGLDLPLGFEFLVWFGRVEHKSLKKSWCWGNSELRLPLDSFNLEGPTKVKSSSHGLDCHKWLLWQRWDDIVPFIEQFESLGLQSQLLLLLGQTMANPSSWAKTLVNSGGQIFTCDSTTFFAANCGQNSHGHRAFDVDKSGHLSSEEPAYRVCRAGRHTQLLESVGSLADGFFIEWCIRTNIEHPENIVQNRHTHTNNERNLPSSQELFQYLLVEMCSPFPLASNVATHQFTFLEVVGSSWLWSVLGLLCSAQTQYRKDWICMKMVISPNTKLICTDFKEVWSQQSHGAGCIWHGWLFTDVWHGQDRINHLSHSNSRYNSSYRHYSCCNSYSGCGTYGGSSCHSFDATLWLPWQAWQAQLWAWAFW